MQQNIFNKEHNILGGDPSLIQAVCSLMSVFAWFLLSIYFGKIKCKNYLINFSFLWLLGLSLYVIAYYTKFILLIVLPVLVQTGPLYGLKYFSKIQPELELVLANVVIVYTVVFIGYFIGYLITKGIESYKKRYVL